MPVKTVASSVPQRWTVCVLCSLAVAFISYKNACYYAIAYIVERHSTLKKKDYKTNNGCPFLFSSTPWERMELPIVLPDFYWNPNVKYLANTAFYCGKVLMVVPAGMLSDLGYYNCVLAGGMLLVAASQLFVFAFASSGVIAYLVIEFFEGVGEAFVLPSVFTLISHWALPSERNFYTALVVAGRFYGTTIGVLLFDLTYLGFRSWSIGQICTGVIGLLWLGLGFVITCTSAEGKPPTHHREYFLTSPINDTRPVPLNLKKLREIPWSKIVSSLPFLSLILAFCSVDWAVFVNILDSFSEYQKYVLRLPEKFSAKSTIMEIFIVPASLMVGLFTDWVNRRNIMPVIVIKKTFTFIGVFSSSIFQVAAVFVGCNVILFWVIYIIGTYTLGLVIPVIYSTPIDLSTQYTGLLMGIMVGATTLCAFFEGKANELVNENDNLDQWQRKYFLFSILSLGMIIPFLFFGSVEAQHWRFPSQEAVQADDLQHSESETSKEQTAPSPTPLPDKRFSSVSSTTMSKMSSLTG